MLRLVAILEYPSRTSALSLGFFHPKPPLRSSPGRLCSRQGGAASGTNLRLQCSPSQHEPQKLLSLEDIHPTNRQPGCCTHRTRPHASALTSAPVPPALDVEVQLQDSPVEDDSEAKPRQELASRLLKPDPPSKLKTENASKRRGSPLSYKIQKLLGGRDQTPALKKGKLKPQGSSA